MNAPFLKPVVGPGWSDAAQAYVENADEKPTRRQSHGPSGWWFEQMCRDNPGLRNNYCRRCGRPLLANGQCAVCRNFPAAGATVRPSLIPESEGESPVVFGAAIPFQGQAAGNPNPPTP
jgi:hypothetical protein